ncbi:tyrosine-type recombinase/integrase [Bacillus methanolicus]|uniref:Tyr recombinase domain-containing protein n=1 Tax=Bacillus methanolicus (strain MGA3 / ATCC 53907) TaxID=796606 RepID=I3E398_BACMM|nr:tyrosine-type recombinase/integrase [Bacillus methanolicus]AIE58943.1 hypothetical protein BMMGA3_02375 [Bacillus methanolicus MGA3]EIJ80969.1 site-specific recombinase [Bacillus methanolicus MGA3]
MSGYKSMTVQPIRSREKVEEIKQILKDQSKRDYFLFVMGINCGLRISDMLQLKVKDVRGKEYIGLRKAKQININATLQNEIALYTADMEDDDYLFPSRKGGQTYYQGTSNLLLLSNGCRHSFFT